MIGPGRRGAGTMLRRRLPLLATVLVVLVAAAALAGLRPAPAAATISSQIAAVLARGGLDNGSVGVDVWNLDAGTRIFAQNPGTPLAPASNMKLVTAATALGKWGLEHRFQTMIYAPQPEPVDGTVDGDLYLKGFGDPSFSTNNYQKHVFGFKTASVEKFATMLYKRGVRRVTGGVVGDEHWFDALRTCPAWAGQPQLALECGPLGALTVNESLNSGNRVTQPAIFAAQQLTKALRAAGIKVAGKPSAGRVPDGYTMVAVQYSAPLPALLAHMSKESDNFFAETLLKGLGKDFAGHGTTAAGATVTSAMLASLGVPPDGYRLLDGSGLSYEDRMTSAVFKVLLRAMWDSPNFVTYYRSLAIAAVDGTLRLRMHGTPAAGNVHAKTGTLDIAVCLSGYVKSANGRRVAFSMLMNGHPMSWWKAASAQDAIAVELSETTLPGTPFPFFGALHIPLSPLETVHPVGGRIRAGF